MKLKYLVNRYNKGCKVEPMTRFPYSIYKQSLKRKVLMKDVVKNKHANYFIELRQAIKLLLNE